MKKEKYLLEKRIEELEKKEKIIADGMSKLPQGTLKIYKNGNRKEYYHRLDTDKSKRSKGRYVRVAAEQELIRQLAQKEYYLSTQSAIEKEKSVLSTCVDRLPKTAPEDVYFEIDASLRGLVTPLFETDESFLKRWLAAEPRDSNPEKKQQFAVSAEETVRSKSEWIIFAILKEEKIPFRYEKPLKICGKTIYPDYTILDVQSRREIYWEHFGKVNDPEYYETMIKKLALYTNASLLQTGRLIITMESSTTPLDVDNVKKIVNSFKGFQMAS